MDLLFLETGGVCLRLYKKTQPLTSLGFGKPLAMCQEGLAAVAEYV